MCQHGKVGMTHDVAAADSSDGGYSFTAIHVQALGPFIEPLQRDLGSTGPRISLGLTISGLWGGHAPFLVATLALSVMSSVALASLGHPRFAAGH